MVESVPHALRALCMAVHQTYLDVQVAPRRQNRRTAARAVRHAALAQRRSGYELLVDRLRHSVPDDGGNPADYRYMLHQKNALARVRRLLVNPDLAWVCALITVRHRHVARIMDSRCGGRICLINV